MKYCAYWVSLRDAPETTNGRSVTVHLPRTQQFTVESLNVESLKSMMQIIGHGGRP